MSHNISVLVGSQEIHFNTGYLAKQADGSVLASCGETILLATTVASKNIVQDKDFFPLTIEYREKYYASGKFPGGFIKREGRPNEREILTSRLTDRPLRPLFPKDFTNDVQVIIYVLSSDNQFQPDVIAICAASMALLLSGLPFNSPVGAVRIGRIDGKWVINPSFDESTTSDMDLIVAGTKNSVTMIEGSAKNITEADILKAIEIAQESITKICETQEKFAKEYGKPPIKYTPKKIDQQLMEEIKQNYFSEIENLIKYKVKLERETALKTIITNATETLMEKYPDTIDQVNSIIDDLDKDIVRKLILENNIRADGRGLTDIRPIDIMVGILPRCHGSAIFTRGETQSLNVVTLGSSADSQKIDSIIGESFKTFMLHYNFPNFSVGEVGRFGGIGRREIGHGTLAEKSLEYVLPDENDFPYTIRLVSEILESNGSSSMASVCSGSLSMFNAGIPLKSSVAGVAMGLIKDNDKYTILSDILGLEDHLGDMDFKVAGTSLGITGFQMDIKIEGISLQIIEEALEEARKARLHILKEMDKFLPNPEKNLSTYAPKIKLIQVPKEKIGDIIGPGGKIIKSITEATGASINIKDNGSVSISGLDLEAINNAIDTIRGITEDVEIGKIYHGVVKKIMEFGAFVEILPGKEGLLHISNLDFKRINKVEDVLKEGDKVTVKLIGKDKMGRLDLSRKDALKK